MKCPKCGYNSFEFLDQCKKCSTDLTNVKKRCGIKPLLQPQLPPPVLALPQEKRTIEPPLAPAGELVLDSAPPKPTDLFDLGVFAATDLGRAAPAAEAEEIVLEGAVLPPPTAWAQPGVLGRREEFDEGEETSALLLEEMVTLEEVTGAAEDPPLIFDAGTFQPVVETLPETESPPPTDAP
ncbi:hypothetical protein [Geomesophilobacter sediminis]|uniref:Uncharacterized protein n=1 Tax=Geomesophilobacter sediminis TaxID=2798584 RepID=A0A8J7LUI0_9BACT|nr:hypothetical protein [Geomesophilobacter sediminis]MBJ6724679.1 hypothetical protein [Geomesophilobacter sediminis]